jgi:poly-gamma-glutamate synthesis protein (capsule biosynthesis protein)
VNERLPRAGEETPGVCVLHEGSDEDLVRAADQVRAARTKADIVVLMLHWGKEYETEQTAWQRHVAAALAEAGADILFGGHPHVLQTVETVSTRSGRQSLVAYSLGNFLSSQNAGIAYHDKDSEKALRGDGIILKVFTGRMNGKRSILRAEFLPLWTLREGGRAPVLPTPISITDEIVRLESRSERTREQEELLKFLEHRKRSITGKITGNVL